MAKATKEEKKNLKDTLEELSKKYNRQKEDAVFISTGSIGLDLALGGGISTGRITEILAWEGAGKTTFALHTVAEAQKLGMTVLYIDSEFALSEKYARAIGVDWDKLIIHQPMYGEEAFDYAGKVMQTGEVGLIVFDSISGMIPKKQLEDPAGSHNLGLHARLFSAQMPVMNSLCSVHNTALIFISQIREKIGVMFGSPETTQAGNSTRFFASNRIELRRTVKKETNEDSTRQETRFKTLKCKTGNPFVTGAVEIEFGRGIDQPLEIIECLHELELGKKYGSSFTHDGTKHNLEDFYSMIEDNPEFKEALRNKIIDCIKNPQPITKKN